MKTRLGTGDFVPAGAPNPFARLQYLRAVSRCVPDAVQALVAVTVDDDAAFLAWSQRWGFTDTWARDTARQHAAFWADQPELFGIWVNVAVGSWEPEFPRLSAWNPLIEPEAQFDKRIRHYKAAMKAAPGIAPTPTKDTSDDRHFEWLALHHVGGWSLEKIAEQPESIDALSLSTVSEAITSTAALVGVTLRPGRGRKFGRKRKS